MYKRLASECPAVPQITTGL